MSRRRAADERAILPDPLFRDPLLAKFINQVMLDGKKSIAERIVYRALDEVYKRGVSDASAGVSVFDSEEARKAALEAFNNALRNIQPTVEVKSVRIGGATYQVPREITLDRSVTLAMRWLIDAAKERSKRAMYSKLANEVLDALRETGGAFKMRVNMDSMAKANQAFAHYRT